MDRIKRFFLVRVNASSLIEVIMAILIISMVFTIASMVYLNVQRSGFSSRRLAGEILLNEVTVSSRRDKNYESREWKEGESMVYQTVLPHQTELNLKIVMLEVRDVHGKLIAERKKLVYVPDKP